MKRTVYILFLLLQLNNLVADEQLEYPALESRPKIKLDTPFSSENYPYFTIGSSILVQQAGLGLRYRNAEKTLGNDISLNANFSLPMVFDGGISEYSSICPSIKYMRLKYKNITPNSSYRAIAYEGIVLIDSYDHVPLLIPNIGFVWGTERENMRFTQLQLNAVPAATMLVGMGLAILGSGRGSWISDRELGLILTLGSATVLCSYSAGF